MNLQLEKDETEYLKAFLSLYHIHQKMFGDDKHPDLPSLFTEKVCRRLLNLNEYKGQEFDATDELGKTIEIKGTCIPGTQTTFSQNIADRYIWIELIPKSNSMIIIELNRDVLLRILKNKKNKKKNRVNVDMATIRGNKTIKTLNFK